MRRDVVVDHGFPVRDAEEELGNGRADGKMEDNNVGGRAELPVLAVIAPQAGQPGIKETGENVRAVSLLAEDLLDFEHLVGDGVAISERSRKLVDFHQAPFSPSSR